MNDIINSTESNISAAVLQKILLAPNELQKNQIGYGKFSKVYKVQDQTKTYAVK